MPPLTADPTVFVFPANGKISAAKIRKYTFASNRGLSVYEEIGKASPGLASTPSPALNGLASSAAGPSSVKKRRLPLKNSLPDLAVTTNTLASSSKRKRKRRQRIINLDVDMYFEDGITPAPEQPEFLSDSDESSDMSTLTPPPPSEKGSPLPDVTTPEDLEYGAGFTSYYVIDDDDEAGKGAAKAPPVAAPRISKQQEGPRQQAPLQSMLPPQLPPPQTHHKSRASRSRQSAGRTTTDLPPQQFRPAVPQPTVKIIDNIQSRVNPNKPVTVAEAVKKLDVLSVALVKFGGVPPSSQSQGGTDQGRRNNKFVPAKSTTFTNKPPDSTSNGVTATSSRTAINSQRDEPVDDLLAMFDEDGDSDDDADGGAAEDAPPSAKGLDDSEFTTGTDDQALIFGIEFIMNALRTWAKQRIDAMYTQQWHQYNDMVRHQQQQHYAQSKKNRGRPKKDELPQIPHPHLPPPPSVINAQLTNTPEGEAVQAFQDVLDCKVLKVNGILPTELTRALGTLYVQIDHLINNSAREKPKWECMSYQAQIKAHSMKVQRWKEQMVMMQTEMAKQQEMSHQHTMTQMGVPPHMQHRGVLTQEQALRHHDMSLEMKRSEQQASQQPHLTQYLTTPVELETQKANRVSVPSTSASPVNGGAANVPNPQARPSSQPIDPATIQTASSRVRDAMSHVTMYHGGNPANVAPEHIKQLSMRSGQGMKFSFDHGEAARKVFGDQAFPSSAEYVSNIPRRGPMAKPVEQPAVVNGVNGVNGHVQTPVLGSNAPPLNGTTTVPEPSKEKGKGNTTEVPINGASSAVYDVNMNGIKGTITYNGANGTAKNNEKDSEEQSESAGAFACPAKSPIITNKRKLSDTVIESAPASPATVPKKKGGPTIRFGKPKNSSASATPPTTIAADATAVE